MLRTLASNYYVASLCAPIAIYEGELWESFITVNVNNNHLVKVRWSWNSINEHRFIPGWCLLTEQNMPFAELMNEPPPPPISDPDALVRLNNFWRAMRV